MADMADKLDVAIDRAERAIRALNGSNSNQSTIQINAGGVGIWIACTCCAVMLALSVFMTMLYLDQQKQLREINEWMAAVYVQAPALQKQLEEDHGNRKENSSTPAASP